MNIYKKNNEHTYFLTDGTLEDRGYLVFFNPSDKPEDRHKELVGGTTSLLSYKDSTITVKDRCDYKLCTDEAPVLIKRLCEIYNEPEQKELRAQWGLDTRNLEQLIKNKLNAVTLQGYEVKAIEIPYTWMEEYVNLPASEVGTSLDNRFKLIRGRQGKIIEYFCDRFTGFMSDDYHVKKGVAVIPIGLDPLDNEKGSIICTKVESFPLKKPIPKFLPHYLNPD